MELIVTQGQLQKSRARELAKDKKRTYKKMIKKIISYGSIIAIVIVLGLTSHNMQQEAYNNCVENGYSELYCMEHS